MPHYRLSPIAGMPLRDLCDKRVEVPFPAVHLRKEASLARGEKGGESLRCTLVWLAVGALARPSCTVRASLDAISKLTSMIRRP